VTKKIIMWILVALWMGVIFYFSSFNGIDSTRQSKGFLYHTIGNIIDIFDKDITLEEKEEIINKLDHPIRKIAHITVYLILGILVCLAMNNYNLTNRSFLIYTIVICLLYSISDEIHQSFVSERSCEIKDVLIDSIGYLISVFIFYIKRKRV